jgi:hypothetical protein
MHERASRPRTSTLEETERDIVHSTLCTPPWQRKLELVYSTCIHTCTSIPPQHTDILSEVHSFNSSRRCIHIHNHTCALTIATFKPHPHTHTHTHTHNTCTYTHTHTQHMHIHPPLTHTHSPVSLSVHSHFPHQPEWPEPRRTRPTENHCLWSRRQHVFPHEVRRRNHHRFAPLWKCDSHTSKHGRAPSW